MWLLELDYRDLYIREPIQRFAVLFEGHGGVYLNLSPSYEDPPLDVIADALISVFAEVEDDHPA